MQDSSNLKSRVALGVQWRFGGAVVRAFLQFGTGALLAHLLKPADFGLVAVAFIVLGFTSLLGDLGMSGAVMQRPDLTARHVRTAFSFSVLLGLVLASITAILAPFGAALMNEPHLTSVLRALSLTFLIRGFGVVSNGLLSRKLAFKRLFYIDVTSYLLGYGVIAVMFALLRYGLWSLVWAGLAQTLLFTLLAFCAAPHDVRPLLRRGELRDLLSFGTGYTLNGLVNYAALNSDNFVVGRWIGPAGLGLYSRAYNLMGLPWTYTASAISGVLFPAFSQIHHDVSRLRRGYLTASSLTAISAAPIMGGMAVAAPHLIRGVYGSGWEGMIVPFQILCAAGYFRALYHLGGSVIQASGQVYREVRVQVIYAVAVAGGSLFAVRFGITGVAVVVAAAVMYMYAAMGTLALKISGSSWTEYLRAQSIGLRLGLLVSIVAGLLRFALESAGMSSLLITSALVAVCGLIWMSSILVVVHSPNFDVFLERIPARLRRLLAVPCKLSNSEHSPPATLSFCRLISSFLGLAKQRTA